MLSQSTCSLGKCSAHRLVAELLSLLLVGRTGAGHHLPAHRDMSQRNACGAFDCHTESLVTHPGSLFGPLPCLLRGLRHAVRLYRKAVCTCSLRDICVLSFFLSSFAFPLSLSLARPILSRIIPAMSRRKWSPLCRIVFARREGNASSMFRTHGAPRSARPQDGWTTASLRACWPWVASQRQGTRRPATRHRCPATRRLSPATPTTGIPRTRSQLHGGRWPACSAGGLAQGSTSAFAKPSFLSLVCLLASGPLQGVRSILQRPAP